MKIAILGSGGHGKVVCDAILSMGVPAEDVVGFIDDDPAAVGRTVMGFPVLQSLEKLGSIDRCESRWASATTPPDAVNLNAP